MGIVVGVLIAVQLGISYAFQLRNPTVVQPTKPLQSFPLVVKTEKSDWTGKDEELDKEVFDFAQLDAEISRVYTNGDNRTLSLLLGAYNSPATGLYHSPFNCYDRHGFNLKQRGRQMLQAPNRPDTELSLSTWEKGGQTYVVGFWYELGDHTLYERDDMAPWKPTVWKMAGKSKWPVTFKVLIQSSGGDPDQAIADVMDMAKVVREWLGTTQPSMD